MNANSYDSKETSSSSFHRLQSTSHHNVDNVIILPQTDRTRHFPNASTAISAANIVRGLQEAAMKPLNSTSLQEKQKLLGADSGKFEALLQHHHTKLHREKPKEIRSPRSTTTVATLANQIITARAQSTQSNPTTPQHVTLARKGQSYPSLSASPEHYSSTSAFTFGSTPPYTLRSSRSSLSPRKGDSSLAVAIAVPPALSPDRIASNSSPSAFLRVSSPRPHCKIAVAGSNPSTALSSPLGDSLSSRQGQATSSSSSVSTSTSANSTSLSSKFVPFPIPTLPPPSLGPPPLLFSEEEVVDRALPENGNLSFISQRIAFSPVPDDASRSAEALRFSIPSLAPYSNGFIPPIPPISAQTAPAAYPVQVLDYVYGPPFPPHPAFVPPQPFPPVYALPLSSSRTDEKEAAIASESQAKTRRGDTGTTASETSSAPVSVSSSTVSTPLKTGSFTSGVSTPSLPLEKAAAEIDCPPKDDKATGDATIHLYVKSNGSTSVTSAAGCD